jgi:putative ABC transport system permease protein
MGYLQLFVKMILRPLLKEPARTALTVFAVALGVAVVLAIELAGQAAAGSFRSSVETLAGDADFEVTAVGGVPEPLFASLVTLPYPLRVRPRIEDYAVLADTGETLPLIGVDIIADGEQATGGLESVEAFADTNTVWVSANLGRKPGDRIKLVINDHLGTYTVGGILTPRSGQARTAEGEGVVVMDVALAMRELGRHNKLDRVLIQVPEAGNLMEWEKLLRRSLPADVSVEREGARTDENRRMLQAFRWNLRVLSYIALIVGAFLIYNTIAVSVVRRRPEIGILRALGASRSAVLVGFLGESIFFGFAGGVLGLFLGRLMAAAAVKLIASTVESLYVSSRPAPISLTLGSLAQALGIGLAVAVASALSPAWEAAWIFPMQAMARGRVEYEARVHKERDLLLAAALGVGALLASRLAPIGGKPVFGYVSALLLVGAFALSIAAIVAAVTRALSRLLLRLLGVEALLACRSLVASLRRTSVLVGALSTAIAMMVSVGIMVGSFRETVQLWMENQLQADFFLRPAGPTAADRHPTMAPEVAQQLASLPGVSAVGWLRAYSISYQGLPATLAGVDSRVAGRFGKREFLSPGNRQAIFDQLSTGDYAIASEPFASKHRVQVGDAITLPLGGHVRALRILGIYYDYGDERGYIIMDRSTLLKYLPDPAPSSLAVYLEPGAAVDGVRRAIQRVCSGRTISVLSNRTLRREALRIFDRTFAITYALEAVAVVVAVMGVAGALLALVIDRRRELGLLRFLGGSPGQVRRLILMEAGLLGLLANLAGFALGVLLSLILIFVINKQSFGWTIQFHWPVALLLGGLSLVYAATLATAIYPAGLAMRLRPIEVIHEE